MRCIVYGVNKTHDLNDFVQNLVPGVKKMPRMVTNGIVKRVDFPKNFIIDRVCLMLYQISNTPVFATGQGTEKRPNRIASVPLLLLRGLRYLINRLIDSHLPFAFEILRDVLLRKYCFLSK